MRFPSLAKISVGLLSVAMLAACGSGEGAGGGESTPTTQPVDSTTTSSVGATGPTTTTASDDTSVPDGVVEAAVEQAVTDTGVDAESLEIVTAQQVVWSDASLGCPQEGQSYIQVLTDGYWVVFDSPEGELDYRSTLEMDFTRCEDGRPPHSTQADS